MFHTGILAETVALTKTSSACYSSGGDCGFHFLSCDHALVISLRTMNYGFKEPAVHDRKECERVLINCADLVDRKECCEYEPRTDCLKTYSYDHLNRATQNCDGTTKCSFHATRASGGCRKAPRVYNDVSTYSVLTYVCVNVTGQSANHNTQQPVNQYTKTPANEIVGCGGCTGTTSRETDKEARERQRESTLNTLTVSFAAKPLF